MAHDEGYRPEEDWRPGPEVERAHSCDFAFCGDPKCGLHIVAQRINGKAICEIVMSADQTLRMLRSCSEFLDTRRRN